jgi:integrase
MVVRIRDKAAEQRGRHFASYVKACLSIISSWGADRGYLERNPAEGVKNLRRARGSIEANRPWSDDEVRAVLECAPKHMKLPLALMMFTGMGPADTLGLPKTFYRNGEIATRRAKTGEPVYWLAPDALQEVFEVAPDHNAITLCANSDGRPWTSSGFRASWRTLRIKLEEEHRIGSSLTLYGLRHTMAVLLRECGYDERTIADALGQATPEMARHYARGADLKQKMRGVVQKVNQVWNERCTKLAKP